MKLKLFMIAKSDGHGLSMSSHFQVQGVMYGIGPSSHYEVTPVKLVALESGRRLLSHAGIISSNGGIWGHLPVNTVRSQIGG